MFAEFRAKAWKVNAERSVSDISELVAEIHGKPHFAWWPVRLRVANGLLPDGRAWLTWVVRKRCIGFPAYFYARKF